MKPFHKILIVSLLVLVIGAGTGIYMFQKAPTDVAKMHAHILIEAEDLLIAFQQNEQEANAIYTGKVIVVSGTIQSLQISANNLNVVLAGDDSFYGINCSFKSDQLNILEGLNEGAIVKVKGLCKGYLDDVMLTQCTIEQP